MSAHRELYRRAWCAIHGEPEHLHRAVCAECAKPLGPDLVPSMPSPVRRRLRALAVLGRFE